MVSGSCCCELCPVLVVGAAAASGRAKGCAGAALGTCAALGTRAVCHPEPNETECSIEAMPEPLCLSSTGSGLSGSHILWLPVCVQWLFILALHSVCSEACSRFWLMEKSFGLFSGTREIPVLNFNLLQDLPRMVHGDCKMPVVGETRLPWAQILVMERFCAGEQERGYAEG